MRSLEMRHTATLFLLALLLPLETALATTDARRVLLFPANVASHRLYFTRMGAALTARGHSVRMLVPNNTRLPADVSDGIERIVYDVTRPTPFIGSQENSQYLVRALEAEAEGGLAWLRLVFEFRALMQDAMQTECEELLQNTVLLHALQQARYQLLIFDPMDRTCAPALAYKLDIPLALVSLPTLRWFYRVPSMPSVTPAMLFAHTDTMSFTQRVKNLAFELMYDLMSNSTTYFVGKYVPERPAKSGREIIRDAVLWFYLHEDVLHYPLALMPNTVAMGAIMLREAESPLPAEYTALLNQSHRAVILVALGATQTYFPDQWIHKFCQTFRELSPDILVLWKMSSPPACELPTNVVTKAWLPQNELLAHPKLRLFITHAGWNSYAEASYHATPMIALPLFGDQPYNAAAMASKGLGVVMDIRALTPEEMLGNITHILSNDSFTAHAQRQAALLRQQPMEASHKVAFWVEHVIQYGGEHLRNSGYNLSLYEFLMLDILAGILMVVIIVVSALFICCRLAVRTLRTCCHATRKEKTA